MPRWPATLAVLAVVTLYAAVSTELTLGSRLLLRTVVVLLVAVLMSAHAGGHPVWPAG